MSARPPAAGPVPVAEDLALALALADAADARTLAAFRRDGLRVETKPDATPVTEVDRAVERELRRLVSVRRPGDAVVGEEYGASGSAARRWIVDPIDGTKNYVRGVPVWATLVALDDGGTVTVGVASAPALGRRWWAARGLGAWAGAPGAPAGAARRCRVSGVTDLADASLSYSGVASWEAAGRGDGFLALARRAWRTRAYGDFWSHVLVAEGAVDASAEPEVAVWDVAALQVIVTEAGGAFTDLAGRARPDGGSVVCTNGALHAEVLALLGG